MARNTTLTIVSYAVNGLGLGHLTRILAINTAIRQFCLLLEQNVQQIILTTSEADTLAFRHSFPAYKMPSITLAQESGIPRKRYNMISRHWVWNTFALWQPDITIVDTFPSGTFEELPQILRDCKKNVFIYRPIKSEQEQNPKFRDALFMYDTIIRIIEPFTTPTMVDERLTERITDISPIILRKSKKSSIFSKEKEHSTHNKYSKRVLILAGGGGDVINSDFWELMITIAQKFPELQFTYAVGALYRGQKQEVDNVIWSTDELDLSEQYYDFAISAGGFNSVYELLYYRLPTVFFSQTRKYDDQERRIQAITEQGLGLYVEELSYEALEKSLHTLQSSYITIRQNLQKYSFSNGSIETAYTVLEQFLPYHKLDATKTILEYLYQRNISFSLTDEKYFLGIIGVMIRHFGFEITAMNIDNIVNFAFEIIVQMNTKGFTLKDTHTLVKKHFFGHDISTELSEMIEQLLQPLSL